MAPRVEDGLAVFQPRTGRVEEWNEAYERVENYLRAHRLHSKLHQQRLALRILALAAERHAADPRQDPVALAAAAADAVMTGWFEAVVGVEPGETRERAVAEGRVAILLHEGYRTVPEVFLDPAQTPQDTREKLRAASLRAGPDLAFSRMVARDLDLGTVTEIAGSAFEGLGRLPLVRFLLLWALFLGVLGLIFFYTR